MGKIITKNIQGMSWWMKTSLVLLLTLATTVFMYEGWYTPKPVLAAPTTTGFTNIRHSATALSATAVGNVTVPAGANRMLVVAFSNQASSSGAMVINAVTYGGVAMTNAGGNATTSLSMHTQIFYLKDNAIMNGTAQPLVVNITGGGTLVMNDIWYAIYTGVDQSATPTVQNYNSGTGTVTSAAFATGLVVPTNGAAAMVGVGARATAAVTYTKPTNFTVSNNQVTGTTGVGFVATSTTAGTDTASVTAITGTPRWSQTGISLAPAATDTTPPTAGTVTVNPDISSTYTSSSPTITTSFTDAESAVTDCQYTTDNGTNWINGTVSGTMPNYTCTATASGLSGFKTINMRATSTGGTTTATAIQRTADGTAPTDGVLTVTPGNGNNVLSWTAATDAGSSIVSYKLVYATGDTPPATCSTGTAVTGSPFSSSTFGVTHTPLVNGTQYSYRLCATDTLSLTSTGATGTGTPAVPDLSKITSCTGCHFSSGISDGTNRNDPVGYFKGSHELHAAGSNNYACAVCHTVPGTTEYDHSNRIINMQSTIYSGSYSKTPPITPSNDFTGGTCNTTTCHGTMSPTWGANSAATVASCVKCHGVTGTTTTAYNADTKLAAPGYNGGRDTGGETAATGLHVGAHAVHLNANLNYISAITCAECHSSVTPGSSNFTGHMDGTGTVTFGNLAKTNSTTASYSAPNCTTYCHFAKPTGSYTAAGAVAWNNTALMTGAPSLAGDCSACHQSPPSTSGNHDGVTELNQCNACHSHVNENGTFADKSLHINGIVEQQGCNSCHSWPPTSTAHTVHIDNIKTANGLSSTPVKFVGNQVCGTCHDVSSLTKHAGTIGNDGSSRNIFTRATSAYQFGPNAKSYAKASTTTCTNVSCHLGTSTAWGTPPTTACQTCHGYPPVTTAGSLNNKHIGTAVNHKGSLANASTATRFLSVHAGGCLVCHGTQDSGSGTHAAYVTYTVATRHFASTTKITLNSTLQYNITNYGCDNAGCHSNDAEHRMTASGKTVDFFKGPIGASGPNCIGCHNVQKGTRAAVTTEFGLAWGHKKTGRGSVANADCIVCHLEGVYATQTTSDTYHANGVIDLRDPDGSGEAPIKDFSNANYSFRRYSTSYAASSRTTSGTTNSIPNIVTVKFCMACHDSNGATNTTARSNNGGTGTQYMPFGGIALGAAYTATNGAIGTQGLINVASQFASTNSSRHPVGAANNRAYPYSTRLAVPYNGLGTTRDGNTTAANTASPRVKADSVVIYCDDCHTTSTSLTRRTITAHGNAATLRGTVFVASPTLCTSCHVGTTNYLTSSQHGSGSAFTTGNTNIGTNTQTCHNCHFSSQTAPSRPVRAFDVHGFNGLLATGGAWTYGAANGMRPIAFMRNVAWSTTSPRPYVATTTGPGQFNLTAGQSTCGGSAAIGSCGSQNHSNYSPGGSY